MNVIHILGIVFIVLKLTNYIDWSWWWVTAPFWGLFIFGFIYGFVIGVLEQMRKL